MGKLRLEFLLGFIYIGLIHYEKPNDFFAYDNFSNDISRYSNRHFGSMLICFRFEQRRADGYFVVHRRYQF